MPEEIASRPLCCVAVKNGLIFAFEQRTLAFAWRPRITVSTSSLKTLHVETEDE